MVDREERILELIDERGGVQVVALAELFDVSSVTIRKDLERLESVGKLKRTRGGAVRPPASVEGVFPERLRVDALAKKAIALEAAKLVVDGDVVAFDTSSTAHFIAREVVDRKDLVVITPSIPTATLFLESPSARVIMPGGILRHESGGLVGGRPDQLSGYGRIRKGFFGVTGLSRERGLLELAPDEAETKRMLAEVCIEVYGVFASEKAGGFGFHSFCETEAITSLITDDRLEEREQEAWRELGVPVMLAPLGTHTFSDD